MQRKSILAIKISNDDVKSNINKIEIIHGTDGVFLEKKLRYFKKIWIHSNFTNLYSNKFPN